MVLRSFGCAIAAAVSLTVISFSPARANDGIFPPSPAAANTINFDGKGFIIDGQRTFIASGGMEYARVPRALWRDRLLKMKRAGFNCTEMYIFWNFHEPKENEWNFSGDHDLNAYLQLIHQLGMYAIVRVGPYVCAEWDSGGYPVWLRFKPGVVVRADNQPFLDETFKYYDRVVPIIAANQINRGGAVIMIQIENEDGDGWGTDHSLYEQKLRDRVLADGIEVPTFFSGLHHGGDPAGDTPWDDATRTNPWFTTEFWCNWYNVYGSTDYTPWVRSTWKILAFGGNGYNYYMLHGGTNFDFYNNNEDASSYDYGAAIGQGGDLRSGYYKFKEAAMFGRAFQDILENSVSSSPQYSGIASNSALKEYARSGPAGTIIFLDNQSNQDVTTSITDSSNSNLPASGPATVPARLMLPVVLNYSLSPQFTIDRSITQVLTTYTTNNAANTVLVAYGAPGGHGSIELSSPNGLKLVNGTGWTATDANHGTADLSYPTTGQQLTLLSTPDGIHKLLIVSENESLAERTWPIDTAQGTHLVIGPDYVGDIAAGKSGHAVYHAESMITPLQSATDIDPNLVATSLTSAIKPDLMPDAPTLNSWQEKIVSEANPTFNDSTWLTSTEPQFMGADGDYSAYAWYRTKITTTSAGTRYFLPTTIRDRMIVFLDGQRLPESQVTTKSAELDLTPGEHSVAILAAHYGRDKLVGYSGPIDTVDAKGLGAPVVLAVSLPTNLTQWQALPVVQTKPDTTTSPSPTDPGWRNVDQRTDVFNNSPGWAWYQTIVNAADSGTASTPLKVHFDRVDDNGTVFCNGKLVGTHVGYNTDFAVDVTSAWIPGQENVISVLDENTGGGGGISGTVTLSPLVSDTLTNWSMRGGVGDPGTITGWTTATAQAGPPAPAFYKAKFIDIPPAELGPYPILRVNLAGMSAGVVWLNGHNLGRYPEKIPVDGLYLPECWLNKGVNTLTIFDEDGEMPDKVDLYVDSAASRYGYKVSN